MGKATVRAVRETIGIMELIHAQKKQVSDFLGRLDVSFVGGVKRQVTKGDAIKLIESARDDDTIEVAPFCSIDFDKLGWRIGKKKIVISIIEQGYEE